MYYVWAKFGEGCSQYVVDLTEKERKAITKFFEKSIKVDEEDYSGSFMISKKGYQKLEDAMAVEIDYTTVNDFEEFIRKDG